MFLLPSNPVENGLFQKLLLDFHAACSRKIGNNLKKRRHLERCHMVSAILLNLFRGQLCTLHGEEQMP